MNFFLWLAICIVVGVFLCICCEAICSDEKEETTDPPYPLNVRHPTPQAMPLPAPDVGFKAPPYPLYAKHPTPQIIPVPGLGFTDLCSASTPYPPNFPSVNASPPECSAQNLTTAQFHSVETFHPENMPYPAVGAVPYPPVNTAPYPIEVAPYPSANTAAFAPVSYLLSSSIPYPPENSSIPSTRSAPYPPATNVLSTSGLSDSQPLPPTYVEATSQPTVYPPPQKVIYNKQSPYNPNY